MSTQIPPLIRSHFTERECHEEIEVRRVRLEEIFAKGTDSADYSEREVKEAKRLNDEVERLQGILERGEWVHPHPGHHNPDRVRSSRSQQNGLKYGRVPGIGSAFLRGVKALDGTSGGTLVPAFFDPQIRDLPQRSLFVRSLIPTVGASGDKVHYLRQTVATQNAAAVAAGATKPTSVYTVERVETPVTTVAHVTEALDRALLADYEELTNFLDAQLRLGVLLEEEDQILNGNGTPPNLRGILQTSGIQTQAKGADPAPDAFYKAMTKIRATAFMEPDGVVVHPNDWEAIRLLRTADGEYIFGDPFDAGPERMFNKPVIISPLIAEGTGLVGAFGAACQVWDREQARVTFAETGLGDGGSGELFLKNQVRFRGESRIAFGVFRPAAFVTVTGI
jgi:HK97 family phage major capsid protein